MAELSFTTQAFYGWSPARIMALVISWSALMTYIALLIAWLGDDSRRKCTE